MKDNTIITEPIKKRLVALIIDVLIVNFINIIISNLLIVFGIMNDNVATLMIFTMYIYFILLPALTSTTIGKRVMNLKMIHDNGDDITIKQAVLRMLPYLVLALIYLIFFKSSNNLLKYAPQLLALIELFVLSRSEDNISWHDKWAKTLVISTK